MKIYFDGGCKPNPGDMEVCVIVEGTHEHLHQRIGHGTNNLAEWVALITTCEFAINRNYLDVTICGDSQLIINQANGTWKCKNDTLKPFVEEYNNLKTFFKHINLVYVPREKNLAGQLIELINQ